MMLANARIRYASLSSECCSVEQEADTSTTGRRSCKSLGIVYFNALFGIARHTIASFSEYMVCSGLRLA